MLFLLKSAPHDCKEHGNYHQSTQKDCGRQSLLDTLTRVVSTIFLNCGKSMLGGIFSRHIAIPSMVLGISSR